MATHSVLIHLDYATKRKLFSLAAKHDTRAKPLAEALVRDGITKIESGEFTPEPTRKNTTKKP